MARLSWRREPYETGLRAMVQGPRGWELRYGGEDIATVNARTDRAYSHTITGWYWVARSDKFGVPWKNTCNEPAPADEEAKAQCLAYVKEHMKVPKEGERDAP